MQNFNDRLGKGEVWSIMALLLFHVFLFPLGLLGAMLLGRNGFGLSAAWINFIYYSISLVLAFLVGGRYLRRSFDNLLDRPLNALKSFLIAWGIYFALTYALSILMMFLPFFANDNPNQSALSDIAVNNRSIIISISVFMAPVVEELIFRGGIFCGLHRKNRILAYVVSILAFSLYHVWQYALMGDLRMLLFGVQYVPAAFALCWCYEKSGSIWTSILMHMSINLVGVLFM